MSNSTQDTQQFIQAFNLAVYIVIITVGCIWNGTLLFMFARHRAIRTTANTMIFNLAVCDVLNLVIVAPLRYAYHYPHGYQENVDLCRFITILHHWILCANSLSIVALSIQRFCISVSYPIFHLRSITTNTTLSRILYIAPMWTVSLLVALPYGMIWEVYQYMCGCYGDKHATKMLVMYYSVFYCIFLPSLLFFLNLATARRLKKSTKILLGDVHNKPLEMVRRRSANVVTALSILFVVSYFPFWIWCWFAYWTAMDRRNATMIILECISKHFLFLNSCFNPVALYMSSSTFRRLFRKYLCLSQCRRKVAANPECYTISSTV